MRDALYLAFGTLTTWRVPPPGKITPTVAGAAMTLAPVAVLPLAVLLGLGGLALLGVGAPPALTAALGLTAIVLSTRAMHLDGLADTADGLSASYDRERALAVMKRSDIGPSGVAAITLALLVQLTALAALTAAGGGGLALAAFAVLVSRAALAWSCRRGYPAATDAGLGATVAGTVSPLALLVNTGAVLAVGTGLCVACGLPWWWAAAIQSVAVLATLALLHHARHRLGGITGDVLGGCVEIALAGALALGAILIG